MYEKFSADARAAVSRAIETAREAGSRSIDSRHLLVGLVRTGGATTELLRATGVDPDAVARRIEERLRDGGMTAEALAALGIDLEAVRARADAVFGPGALDRAGRDPSGFVPFSADAKKALELALRESIHHRTPQIDGKVLLLGLLRDARSPATAELTRALVAAGSSLLALQVTTALGLTVEDEASDARSGGGQSRSR